MPHDFLKKRIVPIDIEQTNLIADMLSAFTNTSFQSRSLAQCAEIFLQMLNDSDAPTIFLGLAGAMIPGGMKNVVSTMIRRKMVNVIVTTGANAYHDFVEGLGYYHYQGSPAADDAELYRHKIDRIYDTFGDETTYRLVDQTLVSIADRLLSETSSRVISSRQLLEALGEHLDRESETHARKDSFVWNCWRYDVPVFIPALCDSSIGLALTRHHINALQNGLKPLIIDQIQDNSEIFDLKRSARKTGVIYVGGGVPKNYIQQTSYLESTISTPNRGHDYGFQLTTDRPEWGGLSGCTFQEGVSWGKEKSGGTFITCYCDATIALPLIVKAVLQRWEDGKR